MACQQSEIFGLRDDSSVGTHSDRFIFVWGEGGGGGGRGLPGPCPGCGGRLPCRVKEQIAGTPAQKLNHLGEHGQESLNP